MQTLRQRLIELSGLTSGTFRDHINNITHPPRVINVTNKIRGIKGVSTQVNGKLKQVEQVRGKVE